MRIFSKDPGGFIFILVVIGMLYVVTAGNWSLSDYAAENQFIYNNIMYLHTDNGCRAVVVYPIRQRDGDPGYYFRIMVNNGEVPIGRPPKSNGHIWIQPLDLHRSCSR